VSSPDPRRAVLYLVTRFPAVTETFVVNEWLALSERFRMQLVALRRSGEAPVHQETARVVPDVRFPSVVQPAAHLFWLLRRPRVYLAALAAAVRGALRFSVAEAVQEAVVFAKAVAVARIVQRERVDRVHAHFASHPATAAWVVHGLTGIPFSFTAHANDLFVAPVLLERKVADASFVIAISEYNRRLLLDRCPGARVEVVHCGVDTERYAWRGLGERAPDRVVCVASLFE
jgi:colanic acid/amylovoran biosynthesis glycosyltransferase